MDLTQCLRHSGLKDHIQAILYLRKKKKKDKQHLLFTLHFFNLEKNIDSKRSLSGGP